jgi:two-component system, chemotaxis family, chemotaxis protein CheY
MHTYNCLIVEDSPMMRQLLNFALSRIRGMKVTEADDGMDGLKKMSKKKYDIFIVDINMPIMDGLKLVKAIRSDKIHSSVPIIIITTEGGTEDRERASQLGVQAYLAKPISAPVVIEKVKSLLKIEG